MSRPFRSREISDPVFRRPEAKGDPHRKGDQERQNTKTYLTMDMTLDLFERLREFPEATQTVHAGDLGHFARELLAEARQNFERERAAIAEGYITPEMVKTLLRISESTLFRMAKAKILVTVFVGGQKRYRRSDLDKILSPS